MKKGSLSLSIQAIVILVMAMAVLGLGLTFIRTLIGQGQDQFEDAIKNVELTNPPTAAEPFRIDANLQVKAGGQSTFKAGIYNTGDIASGDAVKFGIKECQPALTATPPELEIISSPQTINPGDYAGYQAILKSTGTSPTTYICSIIAHKESATATVYYTEQVTIRVNA